MSDCIDYGNGENGPGFALENTECCYYLAMVVIERHSSRRVRRRISFSSRFGLCLHSEHGSRSHVSEGDNSLGLWP